jgi:hypothetical protein
MSGTTLELEIFPEKGKVIEKIFWEAKRPR